MFYSELCKISKNTFSYRTPVAASKYLLMVSVNAVRKDFLQGVKVFYQARITKGIELDHIDKKREDLRL